MLKQLVDQAKAGEIAIVTSTLAIAEVTSCGLDDEAEQKRLIREFFENDYIHVRAVDRRIAESAASISRIHRLKPPDAIHVATAIRWGVYSLQTYDGEGGKPRKLLSYNGLIGNPSLRIEVPKIYSRPGDLF